MQSPHVYCWGMNGLRSLRVAANDLARSGDPAAPVALPFRGVVLGLRQLGDVPPGIL